MRHEVLLVGLGAVGLGYDLDGAPGRVRTHARAFGNHAAFGPVIGVDPSAERRALFEANCAGESFASVPAALEKHRPAVVVIATPTPTHAEVLQQVLAQCTPRLVLCEKPLAYDPESAQAMLRRCAERSVRLYVNYMRRCDPAVNDVRRLIENGAIRGPIKGVVWYSKGLIHNGSHLVDLMRFWLGSVRDASLVRAGRYWEERDPEPDFLLEFPRALITFLAAKEECFSHYTAELLAGNGRLRYEAGGEQVEWQPAVEDTECPGYRVLSRDPQRLPADMARCQLRVTEQVASLLEGGDATLCTGDDALQTLRDIHRVIALLR